MTTSSRPFVLSPVRARNCALMNQFATPGLGSLLAHRWVAGAGQLLVFCTGFVLFCGWFLLTMKNYLSMMDFGAQVDADPHWRLLWRSVVLCVVGWLWALVTSIQLLASAKTPLPPPIPPADQPPAIP